MTSGQAVLGRPIRVVLFGSGPTLERGVRQFICRLEECQDVEYLGGFFQAEGTDIADLARDLWRRRRLLAVPLFLANLAARLGDHLRVLAKGSAHRQALARLGERTWFVKDIHAEETLRRVRSLGADLGVVYGSPILKPELFAIPPLGTLGIHHGKLPAYRGKKTTFWAIYHGEPTVGVSIQRIGTGLDKGAIVREGEVAVGRRAAGAVWRALERLGIELYLGAILDVKRGKAVFSPQPRAAGRLYHDPGLSDLVRFQWRQARRRLGWSAGRTDALSTRDVRVRTKSPRKPGAGRGTGGTEVLAAPAGGVRAEDDIHARTESEKVVDQPRTCILTETYFPVVGGGETQTRALAESLARQGSGVTVLARRSYVDSPRVERVGSVTVRRLPPAGEGHWKKWVLAVSAFLALVRLRRDYDLILVSGYRRLGPAAVLAGKLLGKRCVLKSDSRGELAGTYFAGGLRRLRLGLSFPPFRAVLHIRNRILRLADAFVAPAKESELELAANGVNPQAIWRIPNIVDKARFRPVDPRQKRHLRRRFGLGEDERIVIYTGRLVSYKGLPLLLRCWQDIRQRRQNASLLLVGSGGDDIHNCEEELREYVRANKLESSVRFTGAVTNVEEYLQAADIFAFPGENEAFGISLVEAMACGLPVVTTPVGIAEEIVRHDEDGLLVAPGDFVSLRDALEALIVDRARSDRLGLAASDVVREAYSAEAVTDQYLELFKRIRDEYPRSHQYRPGLPRAAEK